MLLKTAGKEGASHSCYLPNFFCIMNQKNEPKSGIIKGRCFMESLRATHLLNDNDEVCKMVNQKSKCIELVAHRM